jgi:trimeric autotransporter adhesin
MSASVSISGSNSDKKVRVNGVDPPKELNISGTGVTVTDNPSAGTYDIVISGGGGGSVSDATTSTKGIVQLATPSSDTTAGHVIQATDTRLSDTRTPTAHASSHKSGGTDAIKLDELAATTDITALNVSISAHGLTPKAPNDATKFLDGTGVWSVPSGTGGSATPLAKGTATKSGNSSTTVFTIAHGMSSTPVFAAVIPTSTDALGSYVTTFDATNITITYSVPPATATNNLTFEWFAMDASGGGGSLTPTGEANTMSNSGTAGLSLVLTKSGTVLPVKGLNIGSSKLSITDNTVNHTIDYDVVEANLNIANMTGTIANSRITAAAGIVYSKLNLSASIVNADIATAAAIAYSKLALGTSILNSDISASAAIAHSKIGTNLLLSETGLTALRTVTFPDSSGLVVYNSDSRLSDSRTPTAHATSHKSGGSDAIALDTLAATTDITTLNSSTTAHGLLKKLSGTATQYMDGTGAWSVPAGGGGGVSASSPNTWSAVQTFNDGDLALENPLGTAAATIKAGAQTGAVNFTFPVTSSDTITTNAATETLTNKTLTTPNISSITNTGTLTLPTSTDTLVGRTTTDTITNKTIVAASNTITDTSAAQGDVLVHNGTKFVRLGKGSTNQVLQSGPITVAWATFNAENCGIATGSGNGSTTVFNVAHSLGSVPSNAMIICSSHTITFTYTTDSTNIIVTFTTAPGSGTNNVIFHWRAVA